MKNFILLAFTLLTLVASAQTYTEVTGTPFTGSTNPEMAFFDKDGDGDLDVVISSYYQSNYDVDADLYENDGNGNFTIVASPFIGCHNGQIGVGDINGNGYTDIVIIGKNLMESLTTVYINDGAGNFTIKTNTGLENIWGKLVFEDLDGDNDLDIIVSGSIVANYPYTNHTKIYSNDGTGVFTEETSHPLFSTTDYNSLAGVNVADFDNDGDNDIIACKGYPGTIIYLENINNTSFAPIDTLFQGVGGSFTLADVNNDSAIDFILGGENPEVYINSGSASFTKVLGNTFSEYHSQSYCVADFNGDGNEDLIIAGWQDNPSARTTRLYYNDGNGVFTENTNSGFTGIRNGGVIAGDLNNDGELEILLLGSSDSGGDLNKLFKKQFLVTSITVQGQGGSNTLDQGSTLQMETSVLPTNASDISCTWSVVAGSGSATIDANGLLTGITVGTLTVYATANDGSGIYGQYTIEVLDPIILISSITIDGQGGISSITTAETLQMVGAVLPTNASDASCTWSVVAGSGSATIDANGLVTPSTIGTVTINATANDGSGTIGLAVITITAQSTGITTQDDQIKLNVYPNPTKGLITIESNKVIQKVEVYSIAGQQIYVGTLNDGTLNVSHLIEGIYTLKIISDDGTAIQRIIKD